MYFLLEITIKSIKIIQIYYFLFFLSFYVKLKLTNFYIILIILWILLLIYIFIYLFRYRQYLIFPTRSIFFCYIVFIEIYTYNYKLVYFSMQQLIVSSHWWQ